MGFVASRANSGISPGTGGGGGGGGGGETLAETMALGASTPGDGTDLVVSANDQISADPAAVGSPVYSFTGDLTSGIWQSAAGAVTLSCSGSQVAEFSSAGLVVNAGNIANALTAEGTVGGGTYEIDLDDSSLVTMTISANTTFSATGYSATIAKQVSVLITASGGDRTVSFPASWKWLGLKPSQVASGATGMLSIVSTTNADTGVVAAYELLGTGS